MTGKVDSVFLCWVVRGAKLNLREDIFVDVKCESGTLGSAMLSLNDGTKETGNLLGAYWVTLGGVTSVIVIGMVGAIGSGSVAFLKISDKWKRAFK